MVFIAATVALLGGRAALKAALARRASIETATLPVNTASLEWLTVEHASGRRIGLFSAANDAIVNRVAERFGLFADAQGSDEHVNLGGSEEVAVIEARYGPSFAYAGDHEADVPVWRHCGRAIRVGDVDTIAGGALPDGVGSSANSPPPPFRCKPGRARCVCTSGRRTCWCSCRCCWPGHSKRCTSQPPRLPSLPSESRPPRITSSTT